jgi:HAD superfamily hydrolase (TIGR01484 family)
MIPPLLICTDLDRTLLPNGPQPESPGVREILARLVSGDEIDLVYVSGRDLQLVAEAMETYRLPRPRLIIGDVGTSIYESVSGNWRPSASWRDRILRDWSGHRPSEIVEALVGIEGIRLQEMERQGPAKVSYFTDADAALSGLEEVIAGRLARLGIRYRLVLSRDEVAARGLLDILPSSASKLHAIEFLIERWHYHRDRVVFAGDSGNDLEVLKSDLPSVLVANAEEEVRTMAAEQADRDGHGAALYMARGGFLGANGNYAAGILEGVAHFFPETVPWMKELQGDE